MADRPLTLKQKLFVTAYVGEALGNATEAASIAGYKGDRFTLGVVGCENLKKPSIKAAIDVAFANDPKVMSSQEILQVLTDIARATDTEETKDNLKALDQLAKCRALYTTKTENKNQTEVNASISLDITDDAPVED